MPERIGPLTLKEAVTELFNLDRRLGRVRLESHIWAAKNRACPTCPAEPFQQCMNMTDVSHAKAAIAWGANTSDRIRPNKWPHSDRVDWQRLYDALIERGYVDQG